jgi:hypothetical protein
MRRREDADDKTYFRSDRIYSMNGQWYFGAREGDCGPFPSREGALAALGQFVNEMVELGSFQKSREGVESLNAERLRTPKRARTAGLDASKLLI